MRAPVSLAVRFVALAAITGCAAQDGAQDAGLRAASLVQVEVSFTRDRGPDAVRLDARAHFARFRDGELSRATTLLGLGHDDEILLDGCALVDGAEELDRAFTGGGSADVELLDAGRLVVRGPADGTPLARRRYPDLTPEVSGIVYSAGDAATLTLQPGSVYVVAGEGGDEVGPFTAAVLAPRAFPSLDVPLWRRGGDLELRWLEAGEVSDPLVVSVAWSSRAGAREVRCRVRDDGSFVVPRALLAALPTAEEAWGPTEVTATRVRRGWFTAPGAGVTPGQLTLGLREVAPLIEVEAE